MIVYEPVVDLERGKRTKDMHQVVKRLTGVSDPYKAVLCF